MLSGPLPSAFGAHSTCRAPARSSRPTVLLSPGASRRSMTLRRLARTPTCGDLEVASMRVCVQSGSWQDHHG
eukprot:13411344-Alexandrium_andersonii.AAC.1